FIVGFPGESEQDFQASCELVRKAGYKNSFIFKYSPRDGTAATRISDDVPDHVKRRRNSELLAVQNEVSLAHNADLVGTTQRVLVEGPSLRANKQPSSPPAGMVQLTGRTRGDHIVVFHASPAMIGRFADVHIASATALSLTGTL
ncbi:MAG: TRAM domain-containing protein, partial [Planctomycetes bacterium]|nr:TRAM domain-containing protein [Planctomycetota bacterium]